EFTGFSNNKTFAWSDISNKSLDEVLQYLEFTKNVNLKESTIKLMQSNHRNANLVHELERKEFELERHKRELAQLMGVKASSRRLAGNIKRRLIRKKK